MAVKLVLSLALLAATCSLGSGANQCYQCGYQQEGDGPPMALPGMPECKDTASQQDHKVECQGEDDCCGSIREWLEIEDTETGEHKSLLVGRHDCESALANYAKYGVLCGDHTDECVDVDLDSLPEGHNETMMRAKVCFCSGPLCNWHVPGLDTTLEPEPTKEPTTPTQKGKQCYNCGYRKLPNGEQQALPEIAECNDFATPEDLTVNCANGDDCCASMKSYFTTEDETTGEKSTVIIGRHGCESDLSHIGEQGVICSEHTDACVNIDHSSLPNINDNNVTITDMEICFCSGDRCNAEDPIPPEPTTGSGVHLASSLAMLIIAFLF
eukprot:TRINITY_DN3388_c0_g1_i8.p1 TRINITY_DN3388_c0_g1~~TRINITY_DN3388_c0_g1_i8.p1  ORF type:complete len:326 (-),score=81.87 TRINITY_DN3388_c0_g1_i8:164-1141(-)